jgi:hypothetical protein
MLSASSFSRFRTLSVLAILTACTFADAAVYPGANTSTTFGRRQGVWMVVRGTTQPNVPVSAARIAEIQASITRTRQFYAANSGGQFDLKFPHILDTVIPTQVVVENGNTLHRRVGDAWEEARNYVRTNYPQANINSAYVQYFDVSGTSPDAGQGWSGIAFGNNVANQENITSSWGQIVSDHELGHRLGVPHAGALRNLNENNYTPYVYDAQDARYEVYSPTQHGHHVTTYGVHNDEYGNPFDVVGNIRRGHLTVHEKLTNTRWLTNSQVPDLNARGAGEYRIYAHDQLTAVYDATQDVWGVENGYAADKLYGLTYQRPAERFNRNTRQFENYTQTITLEYRTGRDGLQFHLDDAILDLDSEGDAYDRNNLERELEVGKSISDIQFGSSIYVANGEKDDFLSYNPPPPSQPWQYMDKWFEFSVTGLGTDTIGNFLNLTVSLIDLVDPGDFNNDGLLNATDINLFRGFFNTTTTGLSTADKFLRGDMDFNGRVDLNDLWLLSAAFGDRGAPFSFSTAVPEPTSLALFGSMGLLLFAATYYRRTRAMRLAHANTTETIYPTP